MAAPPPQQLAQSPAVAVVLPLQLVAESPTNENRERYSDDLDLTNVSEV